MTRFRRELLIRNLLTYVASVVASAYGLWVARGESPVAIAWPASAVALSAIAVGGWRLLPGIALGGMTAALLDHRSPVVAPWFALPAIIEVAIAIGLIRWVKINLRFGSVSDSLNLAWIAAVASTGGALTGAAILVAAGTIAPDAALPVFVSWLLGDAVGILAFAPALLLWLQPPLRIARPRRPELVAMLLAAGVVSMFVLVQYSVGLPNRSVPTLLALFPLLLWISLRADLPLAALLVVMLSVAGTLGVKLGTGALISPSVTREIINVQTFQVLSVLLVLIGAASVSERERALARSLASEQQLSLIFEGTSDVHTLYELDANGQARVLMGNRRWFEGLRLFRAGIAPQDTIGRTMDEVGELLGITPPDREPHRRPMEEAIRTGKPVQYEVTVQSPVGPRQLETMLVPVGDAARPSRYVLATARDVTERRASERRLVESELRFAAVSDATHDVQMLFAVERDTSLRLTYLNRAGFEAYATLWPDAAPLDPSKRTLQELQDATPDVSAWQLERNIRFMREAITTARAVRFEDTVDSAIGQRVGEVNVIPITDDTGRVTHVLRSSADITDRKIAEAAHRKFSEDLERRVRERTAQLEMANRELEAFSYSLSHDLRAPLRSMEGFSRALLEDYGTDLPADARDYVQRIHAATSRMKQLLEDLLRLSQLPTAHLEREHIDLSAMARSVLTELQTSDPARAVCVEIQDGMEAHADARLVSIAMENLLSNAWKYTSKRADAVISVGQHVSDGVRVTFVSDNGAGFDPQFAGHLFAPFQRLHKAEEYDGAGIGLATVRRIVAAHGGRVWAEGKPHAGATFFFTLDLGIDAGVRD